MYLAPALSDLADDLEIEALLTGGLVPPRRLGDFVGMANTGHLRNTRAESVLTPRDLTGHLRAETAIRSTIFTIFEGTRQIQRMLIGRAVTRLDVR